MADQAFKEAAQTSPMGSEDADIQWMDNDGKIIAPTLNQKLCEYAFDIPNVAKMRAFHNVPVPSKKSGKTIYKRVRRAYPMSRPVSSSSDAMPAAKRMCIFPPSFRVNQEPAYFDNKVENAAFWDNLSAKVHTRNALYSDNVLPWTDDALPLRQKHWRDSTIDTPTSPAVDVAMVLNLEKMALASTSVLRIADMTDPVIKDIRQERRKAQFVSLTSLPTIEEESEPGTPGPVRTTARSTRRRQRRWSPTRYCTSPIRRSTKPARVSPSPERSPAKRIDDAPVPSTPTRVLFSKIEVHLSPSKNTSSAPAESPLRVFSSNEPESITPANGDAQCQESSHIQRTRRSQGRRSLASQAKISAIDEKEVAVDLVSVPEGSDIDKATVDGDPKTPSIESILDAGLKHRVAESATADPDLENPMVEDTTVGAGLKDPTVEETVAGTDSIWPVEKTSTASDLEGSITEKTTSDPEDATIDKTTADLETEASAIEKPIIDADSDESVAEKTIFYTGLEERVIDKTIVEARLGDSVLEQTKGQTLRTVDVYFGPKSERRLSDASAPSIPEYSVNAREQLDIFSQPITAVKSLADVATGVKTAISDSKVIVEKIDGKLVVRFKLPSTYADVFNSRYPSTSTTAIHGDSGSPHNETDVGGITHLSTNTDELIAGLPGTPTHIVLGGSPVSREESRRFPSSTPTFPTPTPKRLKDSATPIVSESSTLAATRVEDQATPAMVNSPALAATRVEDDLAPAIATPPIPTPTRMEELSGHFIPDSPALAATRVEDRAPPSIPSSSTLAAMGVEDESAPATTTATATTVEEQSAPTVRDSPTPAAKKVEDQVPTSPSKNQTPPATFDSLLDSPFAPSCAGTPKRSTPASPSRALEHNVPSEPREMSSGSAASQSSDLAEDHEAATARAFLDNFLSQHKASKAAKSTTQGSSSLLPQATGTSSPKPRTPLGHVDVNSASPMKAGAKRSANDEEEGGLTKPPTKRGRKGSSLNLKAVTEAPLRRSSRVRAKAQETPGDGNSKIPVRVGSNVLDGPAAGGETMEATLTSVTRANTRRNKGKAVPPAEVLARQREDPASHRMQELKKVHAARTARAGKVAKKGVKWGKNSEVIFDPEEESSSDDEEPEKKAGTGAGRKKKATKAAPAPVKRQTRASTRRAREGGGAL